jgi:hypothetical protein
LRFFSGGNIRSCSCLSNSGINFILSLCYDGCSLSGVILQCLSAFWFYFLRVGWCVCQNICFDCLRLTNSKISCFLRVFGSGDIGSLRLPACLCCRGSLSLFIGRGLFRFRSRSNKNAAR